MRKCRLQWFGHVRRRDRKEDMKMVPEMRVQGKRKAKVEMILHREAMRRWGLSEKNTDNKSRWNSLIELGAPEDCYPHWTMAD